MFGAILGGLAASAIGIAASKKTSKNTADLNVNQQRTLSLNQPSWDVQGLRDAGINPMLAVGQGGSYSANSAINSASTASPVDLSPRKGSLEKLFRDKEAAEMRLMAANTSKSVQDTITSKKLGLLYDAQSAKELQDVIKMARENKWFEDNKDMYDLLQSDKAAKTLGPVLYALSRLTQTSGKVKYPQLDGGDSK